MKNTTLNLVTLAAVCSLAAGCRQAPAYTDYVDPFIGTAATGHTYPAATTPFGMVQAGPDTGTEGWQHSSGYHADESTIIGFSHTHLSGTGAADMGDILLMPVTGTPRFTPGTAANPDAGYRSRFRRDTEKASPGYYGVLLDDYAVSVGITATPRGAMHKYDFPADGDTGVIIDLTHGIGDRTRECAVEVVDEYSVKGFRRSGGFIGDHTFYFYATFSEPITALKFPEEAEGKPSGKLYAGFGPGKPVLVKIALSTVSEEGALRNLQAELPDWDFAGTVEKAQRLWNDALSVIDAETYDPAQKTIFYTALYHSFVTPNLVTDADGSYRGWDRQVHRSMSGDLYTNYSLWDTYRAVHPFFSLLRPDANMRFIQSMLERYRQTGMLPMNEYGSNETYCMIGYHAVPVIAQAILENRSGFDYDEAFEAMKAAAMDDARGVGLLKEYGYIPSELENNSVSKVLEYAYDDWCIAQAAKKLGRAEDYRYFTARAANYRNHLDPETRLMRGRRADGSWVAPFDPKAVSVLGHGDFTEGNSWQYSFYVPQDMETLVGLMGGDERFAMKLDTLFTTDSNVDNVHAVDVTGLVGQYAHGNEPSHHMAYLYNFAGQPWKTQEMVSTIKRTQYSAGRDGLCGNDDCGQMSCWYIYSALGFYPVTPCMDYYVIGSPSVKRAELRLPGGKTFTVKAANVSPENIYIQSVALNGAPYEKSYIAIEDIARGGTLEFVMGGTPDRHWATAHAHRPPSKITND